MSSNPDDQGSRRLQDWWLELPLSYRVNALLYFLGACALLFLVTTLFSGDDEPRQIEVGAGVTVPASTTTSRVGFPTSAPATVPTTVATSSTSAGPSTTSAPATTAPPPAAPAGPSPTASPDTTSSPATQAPTTSPPAPCRNSLESRCGDFSWDPSPGTNEALTISVVPRPGNPKPGEAVSFDVTVRDPDHVVSENCAEVAWGDGIVHSAPCIPQPGCPAVFGPWTPPSRVPGELTKTYTHTYQGTGQFTVRFTFRSWSTDRCAGLDPYASERSAQLVIAVTPGT